MRLCYDLTKYYLSGQVSDQPGQEVSAKYDQALLPVIYG